MDVEGEDVVHYRWAHYRNTLGGVNGTPMGPAVTPLPPVMEQPEVKAR